MAKKKIITRENKSTNLEVKSIPVPVKWNKINEVPSVYATNILVHLLENEFKLSFFEAKPQIRLNANDPIPSEVQADCVANIILHPQKIPAFVSVLQQQYEVYEQREKVKKT